ncbi:MULTISPECIES: hypothetical protein [unclassified Fibrobacter]|uniref:hypothetical protein n=1 Tax=unclassified Fibrobacter TaxID=2634177 RepID=UPI00091E3430|nr:MULTISPECIES: hypothetical protein [unclassified Fibrobacter]SHK87922.1 hypothetical protein SAMN05720759_10843 [Fibrobacter sp. UWB12]SIO43567.1 hypothetical protein SAMN05720758_2904 [Fibrobacter sp. UWB11]
MNMKKIIPLSLVALSVVGALSGCSENHVAGADIQDNSISDKNAYDSKAILKKMISRVKERKSEAPIAIVSDVATTQVSNDTAFVVNVLKNELVEDSVTAQETFDNVVDSLKNSGVFVKTPAVGNFGDTVPYFNVFSGVYRDENNVVHGPIELLEMHLKHRYVLCDLARLDKSLLAKTGHYELNVQAVEVPTDGLQAPSPANEYRVKKSLIIYDSSIVEQFENDCSLENGSFAYSDSTATCAFSVTPTEGDVAYTDPYWEKYVSQVINRCVVPADSLDLLELDLFDNSDNSEESEQ